MQLKPVKQPLSGKWGVAWGRWEVGLSEISMRLSKYVSLFEYFKYLNTLREHGNP